MSNYDKIVQKINDGKQVRFNEACTVCEKLFGKPRITGSHHVYKTPWSGDPRINIQNVGGFVKPYQVKQLKTAIEKVNEDV